MNLGATLGSMALRSPLIAAAGTVGSVHDFADVEALSVYGAAVAKSVSGDPWPGRPAPRLAPAGEGMLNGIGIQNPGIDEWRNAMPPPESLPACRIPRGRHSPRPGIPAIRRGVPGPDRHGRRR